MKKISRIILTALCISLLTQSLTACSKKVATGSTTASAFAEETIKESAVAGASLSNTEKALVQLTNHMTEKERSSIEEGPLQLLDEPWGKSVKKDPYVISDKYTDGVYFEIWGPEELNQELDENRDYYISQMGYTEEEIEEIKEQHIKNDTHLVYGAVVDGRFYDRLLPEYKYNKGKGYYSVKEGEQFVTKEYNNYDEFLSLLPELLELGEGKDYEYVKTSVSTSDKEQMKADIIRIFEAMMSGEYKTIPQNTLMEAFDEYWKNVMAIEEGMDYSWELDQDAVSAIKDQVTEYHLYDEELDRKLIVHVAVPKGYENEKDALPALVLTDAVWRFNDIAKLLKEMEEGRAKPQLLISIGQDYTISNSDNMERSALFCEGKDKFLDFITDNLMPYLGEKYSIDFENSTLFGHSLGGVFAHYAVCNSDHYENQPFGNYIVGSPAFWSPYSTEMSDFSEQKNDYGYFERNKTMNKKILITGGTDENEDYQEYFGENDSTLDAIAHLEERVNSHCDTSSPMAASKLYKSHHYQYIPDMLIEYVDEKI
ncbi:MAG: hypothetical protein J5752_07410 [Clostridiales bacterium]|nr:hypothetical protein [Clostridiales bacterium]